MTHRIHLGIRVDPRSVGHPEVIRPGQRFFPRFGRRRRVIRVKSVRGEWATCLHEGTKTTVRAKVARLQARIEGGDGRYYRWLGWVSRPSGYPTEGVVVSSEEEFTALSLPEWGQPIELVTWTRLLPEQSRCEGARVSLRADLGAKDTARLQPRDFEPA